MAEIVNASEARRHLFGLMDRAERQWRRYVLTRNGKAQAVLMSAEEYEEWVETLEVMQDRRLVAKIRGGLEDFRKGRVYSHREVFGKPARAKR